MLLKLLSTVAVVTGRTRESDANRTRLGKPAHRVGFVRRLLVTFSKPVLLNWTNMTLRNIFHSASACSATISGGETPVLSSYVARCSLP
jgi:hypothetical protein